MASKRKPKPEMAIAINPKTGVWESVGEVVKIPVRDLESIKGRLATADRFVDTLRECADWHSFCAACGPNVKVDEDGCCAACGGSSMGPGVDKWRRRARALLRETRAALAPGRDGGGDD